MLEVFNIQFKESIKYGMTYSQFWFEDPQLYYIYSEAYVEQQQDRLKEKDILNWQLGQYIQSAICASFDDKGRVKYPNQPYFFAKKEDKPKDVYEMLDRFKGIVAQVNKNF